MRIILNIIFLFSFLFPLTDEQKSRIADKAQDDLSAPNFTLKTLESRNFIDVKSQIRTLLNASKYFKVSQKKIPLDLQEMIDADLLVPSDGDDINSFNLTESVLKKWGFSLALTEKNEVIEGTITASAMDEDLKIIYNIKDDIFSFITSNENNMTFDSSITLDSLKGKVVLINFWATWCGPCRMEIPDFNELYQTYNDKGLEILAISISDSRDALLKFKNAYNIFYPILYGNQREMSKIQMEYGGVYSIPISFLLDKNGEVIRVYPGAIIKQFDPSMYTDLIMNIENALLK